MNDHRTATQVAIARCWWLSAVVLGLWLLLSGPAYLLSGRDGLEGLSFAAGLCLLPGWLVFLLSSRYALASTQVAGVLLGTGLRLLFVLFGTLLIRAMRQNLGFREFIVWLLVFYMATLLTETLQTLRQPPA